jgi:hypothetical protein
MEFNSVAPYQSSPIAKTEKGISGQPDYNPFKIMILTGAYAGQSLDLGIGINEFSTSQTANWEEQSGDHIRPGLNFKQLSPRTFSFKLTFYHLKHDIAHLEENIMHLQERTDGEVTPPQVFLQIGDLVATPCVCTSITGNFQHPRPGEQKGFFYVEVDLEFKLIGGKASPHYGGKVLTSTPLGDYKRTTTSIERQRRGQTFRSQTLLADCLSEESNQSVTQMIEGSRQNDPATIASLDADGFVQSAIAGMFTKGTLSDPNLQTKLKADLAEVLSAKEDGLRMGEDRALKNALVNNNPALAPKSVNFEQIKKDYDLMLDAISKQDIGNDSSHPLYDTKANPTAMERMGNVGSCGLLLRQSGTPAIADGGKKESEVLDKLNKSLQSDSDEEIKQKFGVTTESQVRNLKNGQPYTSKAQFLSDTAGIGGNANGFAYWSKFSQALGGDEQPTP